MRNGQKCDAGTGARSSGLVYIPLFFTDGATLNKSPIVHLERAFKLAERGPSSGQRCVMIKLI